MEHPDGITEQEISDRTADLLSLVQVKRWAIVHLNKEQSVAEHSYCVAIIAMELAQRLGLPRDQNLDSIFSDGWDEADLLWWALVHDAPEAMTGDIDGKFKRDNPDIKIAISNAEDKAMPWYANDVSNLLGTLRWLVKVADFIETSTFVQRWGTGPRCDDIFRELEANLFEKAVPRLIQVSHLDRDRTVAVVRDVMHRSASEANTIQLRRHRRP